MGDGWRRRAIGSGLDVSLRTLATLGKLHPEARPLLSGVEMRAHDQPYAGSRNAAQRLDVVGPRGARLDRLPVVLYLHGGGFRILSKETHWMMAGAFATHGYLVFNANYRLSGEAPFPAAVEDAFAALRWVLAEAPRLGGDPTRVVLAGESAGANLVTALTVACSFRLPEPHAERLFESRFSPRATIPMCGILEVSRRDRFRSVPMSPWVRDRIDQVCMGYLGEHSEAVGDHLALANPLTVLESDAIAERPLPPFVASVGTRDPVLDDTRRLERALAARGVRHSVSYHRGEPHAFQAMVWRPEARRAWRDLFTFVDPLVRRDHSQPMGASS